jgi:hypothetical protein
MALSDGVRPFDGAIARRRARHSETERSADGLTSV